MIYAAIAHMTARFEESELIQLTDLAEAGVIDEARLAQALVEADNRINASVATRYALPLAEVPDILVDGACDIARYRLYRSTPPEHVVTRYKDFIKLLDQIAAGTVQLQGQGAPPPAATGGAQIVSRERLFSRDSMRGL